MSQWFVCSLFGFICVAMLPGCGEAGGSQGTAAHTQMLASPEIIKTKSGIEMVRIPAGSFEMGSGSGKEDEKPIHTVAIDAFLMDRTPVTQVEFNTIAGSKYMSMKMAEPSHFKGEQNPAEQITWVMAAIYCNARSKAEGLTPCYNEDTAECNFQANGYRLPTEAEWEYACRAGSAADYCFGSDARKLSDYAWFSENSGKKTHPVAQKKPNAWGLYDMHGNVAQWCNDIYSKDYYKKGPPANPHGPAEGDKYVLRGGAWDSSAESLRSSCRVGADAGFADACFPRDAIGFRCVRRIDK